MVIICICYLKRDRLSSDRCVAVRFIWWGFWFMLNHKGKQDREPGQNSTEGSQDPNSRDALHQASCSCLIHGMNRIDLASKSLLAVVPQVTKTIRPPTGKGLFRDQNI